MRELGAQANLPWILMGDFNEVLFEGEKRGGNPCDSIICNSLEGFVDELGLQDIRANGYLFIWSNRRAGDELIEERLDRALVTSGWRDNFPGADANQDSTKSHVGRIFRFEVKWLHNENFEETLHGIWEEAMCMGAQDWDMCVRTCGEKFQDWDTMTYKQILSDSKDGVFRVRDAYSLAMEDKFVSSSNGNDPLWGKIWKLDIPPKACMFIWHACSDILPHNSNLALRHIREDKECMRCGQPESTLHFLRDCSWVKEIWEGHRSSWVKPEIPTFREWLCWIMESHNAFAILT
ncbi:hypothetical protein RDABS01_016437 [Bienertia sinuspersici]